MRKPCRCNSSASLRVLLHVQRKPDSGSPRVVGATNSSNAWRSLGSARDLRPPPILRIRPASIAFPGPLLNSRIPVCTVERDKPVAWAITDTPPWGNDWASLAAHSRRCRSSSTDRRAWYFLRMPATSSFRSMRKDYTIYYKCASYLCAVPKALVCGDVEVSAQPHRGILVHQSNNLQCTLKLRFRHMNRCSNTTNVCSRGTSCRT